MNKLLKLNLSHTFCSSKEKEIFKLNKYKTFRSITIIYLYFTMYNNIFKKMFKN